MYQFYHKELIANKFKLLNKLGIVEFTEQSPWNQKAVR